MYEMNEANRARFEAVRAYAADLQRINDALTESVALVATRRAARDAAALALRDADDALARTLDDTTARAASDVAKKAARRLADAEEELSAATRAEGARRRLLTEQEGKRLEMVDTSRAVTLQHLSDVARALDAKLAAALGPVVEVLREADAVATVAGGTWLLEQLMRAQIPSLTDRVAHVDGRFGGRIDVKGDPTAPELQDRVQAASEPVRLQRQLEGYQARADRDRVAVPYVIKGYTTEGTTRQAPRAEPPAPTPRRPPQPQEGVFGYGMGMPGEFGGNLPA